MKSYDLNSNKFKSNRELYDFDSVLLPKKTRSGLNLYGPSTNQSTSSKKRKRNVPVKHWEKSWIKVGHLTLFRWVATEIQSKPIGYDKTPNLSISTVNK